MYSRNAWIMPVCRKNNTIHAPVICSQFQKNRLSIYEPRCEKTGFLHMRKQRRRSGFPVTAKLISAFVFATQTVQSLYFLNTKSQASSHLLVTVQPGVCWTWSETRDRFSHNEAHIILTIVLPLLVKASKSYYGISH